MEQFNTNQVRQIVPVKRGKLEDWISGGYIEPSNFQASPCGKRYLWTRNDVYELAAFKKLVNSGMKPIDAYEFLQAFPTEEVKAISLAEIRNQVDERIKELFG